MKNNDNTNEKIFKKYKNYRLKGNVKFALSNLKLLYKDGYILSYYYLYFFITGIIGQNLFIAKDCELEKNLFALISENISYIQYLLLEDNLDAIFILSELYFNGIIFEKNIVKSKELLNKGILLNCPFCMNLIAILLEKENDKKCIELYEKSFLLGNFNSKCNLAKLYQQSNFVEKNLTKYLEMLEELASPEINHNFSQYLLGKYYDKEKNYVKSIAYHSKAAESGNSKSCEYLQNIEIDIKKLLK